MNAETITVSTPYGDQLVPREWARLMGIEDKRYWTKAEWCRYFGDMCKWQLHQLEGLSREVH